jgi:thiol-disulfide isomerase/thioredoxin
MAPTPSSMLPLGTIAPEFKLHNPLTKKFQSLQELKSSKGTVIIFMCNHCPYVKFALPEIVRVSNDYQKKGISFIAINSNDPIAFPEDAPSKMANLAQSQHFVFPYLFDETQETAKAYRAECTPDFFVFDGDLKCVYRGQLDDSRPGKDPAELTGKDLRGALDCLLEGKPIDSDQKPSLGCNIKWGE